jgi:hypothetical protein
VRSFSSITFAHGIDRRPCRQLEVCQALHLPHQYTFLKRTFPNRRTIAAIARSASSRVAYRFFAHVFLALPQSSTTREHAVRYVLVALVSDHCT